MSAKLITGLDIGSTKVCAVIAQYSDENGLEILSTGQTPSLGMRKGVVVNIEETSRAVMQALEKAMIPAGVEIEGVCLGISGAHVEGINSRAVIAVTKSGHEIDVEDVNRAIDAATAITIPIDRDVLHIIPQEFIVDDQDGVKSPIGMSGTRLEVTVHIITAALASLNNLAKSVKKAGFEPYEIVLEPLASAQAVLSEEEKDLGVALVDIGGGTTDYVIYSDGALRETGVIPVGGNNITHDISLGLRTPAHAAEELKIKYGSAVTSFVPSTEQIEVPAVGGRAPRLEFRQNLADIMQQRIEEILDLINLKLEESGEKSCLAGGVVLTGGVSLTPHLVELATEIFGLPVRIGKPLGVKGLGDIVDSPVFSTAVGLVRHSQMHLPQNEYVKKTKEKKNEKNFGNVLERLKIWLAEFF